MTEDSISLRESVQKIAREKWEANPNSTLAISTGGGKSKIAIDIYNKNWIPGYKVLLVTPFVHLHEENWKKEFIKFQCEVLYDLMDRCCYISLGKYNPSEYQIIILDESHHLTPQNEEEFLQYINPEKTKVLSLTATPPKSGEKKEIFDKYCPIIYTYQVNDAAGEVVNDFRINVVYCELDDVNKNIESGSKAKRFQTTEKANYSYLSNKIDSSRNFMSSEQMKWLYIKRKQFLDNLPSRVKYAQIINDKYLQGKKSIIFAPSITQAEILCKQAYHSKTKDKSILQDFIDGKIDQISSVVMLDEGITMGRIEAGLIMKLQSTEKTLLQRVGRLLRNDIDKISDIYLLVYKNTVEMQYLKDGIQGISTDKIRYITV